MHVIEWGRREEEVPELGLKGTHVVRASVPGTCQRDQCFGDNPVLQQVRNSNLIWAVQQTELSER